MVIVTGKIKEMVRNEGLRVGGDFYETLELKVAQLVNEAVYRAKTNNRNTVFKRDL